MLFADAFPPAVLDLYPASWVPTLQYSVYVRARPGSRLAPGIVPYPFDGGGPARGGRRAVRQHRSPGGAVPPAGSAAAAHLKHTGQGAMACCRRGRVPMARRTLTARTVVGAAAGLGVAGATWSATRHRRTTTGRSGRGDRGRTIATAGHRPPPPPCPGLPLAGMVVGIDPGHNGDNWDHTSYINQLVWNGREEETCDTTGTQEANGYTEAQFAFNVAQNLATILRAQGATVVLTRTTNTGYGPCITQTGEHREQRRRPRGRLHPR